MPGITEEQMKEAHLKSQMNNRKSVLKVAFDSAYDFIGLGNDPKIKNKIVSLAKNHNALMDDAWSLYYDAEKAYYDYLREIAPKQKDDIYPFYCDKIRDVEEEYDEISRTHSKLSKGLKIFVDEKTKQ